MCEVSKRVSCSRDQIAGWCYFLNSIRDYLWLELTGMIDLLVGDQNAGYKSKTV